MNIPKKKVIIIGGGITGLSTAFFLQESLKERGDAADCLLVEAEKRLGGKILTERAGGFIIEGGPDSFITQKPWGLELCRRVGLTDQLVQTNPVEKAIYILSGGKLLPLPEGFNLMVPGRLAPFLSTPLISLPGKIRMGLDLLIPKRDVNEDESIASFVRRRLGEEALRKLAEPILAGIYAGDAEQLSLMATFPQFAELERADRSLIWGMWKRSRTAGRRGISQGGLSLFVSLREGLSSLTEAIRKRIEGVPLRSGQKVKGIRPKERGYEVILEGETVWADAVVVTTGAGIAADWIDAWDPPLAKLLREIRYASTATVSLGFRSGDVLHPLNGFGFVAPRGEGTNLLATTWSSTKFPGRAPAGHVLIRSFLGGAHQENVVERDERSLISLVRGDLRSILGIQADPLVAKVFRWIKASPQYNLGHLSRIAEIEKMTERRPGFFLAGAAYRGVGIPDCVRQGMEAAEKVVQLFSMK